MIVNEKKTWLRMVFAIRGSCLKVIWPRILFVTLFASMVTYVEFELDIKSYSLTTTPFTLVGFAMAIFLGFRNNETYDRFWEGRRLWGQLVNTSRSLSRQILTFITPEEDVPNSKQKSLIRWLIAYSYALKDHLRDKPFDTSKKLVGVEKHKVFEKKNVPASMLLHIGKEIHDERKNNNISEFHLPLLESSLIEITDVQGGCERIKNTPIPYAYNVLIHRMVAIYCLSLPFGLIQTVGVLTPVVVLLISYAFFGLDAIGDEVEQPFEEHENDLPLNSICRKIEVDLLQAIDETEIPPDIQPVNGILL